MEIFFNATEGSIELPTPNRVGTKILAVGESFYGGPYYDQYVRLGILSKIKGEICRHNGYVNMSDIDHENAITATSIPYRYKSNSRSAPGANSSFSQTKYLLSFALDAKPTDPVSITYYFYLSKETANKPTHVISRVEVLGSNWIFPTWAPLPGNFHSLSPIEQKNALLMTT